MASKHTRFLRVTAAPSGDNNVGLPPEMGAPFVEVRPFNEEMGRPFAAVPLTHLDGGSVAITMRHRETLGAPGGASWPSPPSRARRTPSAAWSP